MKEISQIEHQMSYFVMLSPADKGGELTLYGVEWSQAEIRKKDDTTLVIPRPFLLATLKIADDFFRMKKEFEEYKNRAEEKSKELVELLDRSLTRNINSPMEFSEDRLKQE